MKFARLLMIMIALGCCMGIAAAKKHTYTLVIDAGHGGKDPGTMTKIAKEKTIALNVALAFGRYVEQNCPDVRVIYTRKTDVFIPLRERAAIANRNKADVFISIHVNALPGKNPRPVTGMETYTMGLRRSDEKLSAAKRENEVISLEKDYRQHYAGYDPNSPESMIMFEIMNEQNMVSSVELAQLIQQNTCAIAKRPNKGVKQDAFLVLRETSMPACLVELGYISTPSDQAFMTNKKNVDLMALGLYRAFVAFRKKNHSGTIQSPVREEAIQEPVAEREVVQEEPTVTEPVAQENSTVSTEQPISEEKANVSFSAPIFKVQFLTSEKKLKASDARFKGVKNVDSYKEGNLWKYTIGASTDYSEIYRLRKGILKQFPQAFIIAFRNGEKIDAGAAYQEYLRNKKK